jgi:hypothetical protein
MANVVSPQIDFAGTNQPTSESAVVSNQTGIMRNVIIYTDSILPSPAAFQLVEEPRAGYPI